MAGETPDNAPIERIETVFRRIHAERMAGLPFLNPVLRVEAVGFARHGACWIGVLVTPWSMSLLLLPRDEGEWQGLADGTRKRWRFPSGEYEFIVGFEPALGHYQACALMSSVTHIADQDTARAIALTVMERLFRAKDGSNAGSGRVGADPGPGWYSPEKARASGGDELSRRAFLRLGFRQR